MESPGYILGLDSWQQWKGVSGERARMVKVQRYVSG